jgi:hypothetical protein
MDPNENPQPQPKNLPDLQTAAPAEAQKPQRRPRGKVARLAPPLRDKLNELLDEGLEYGDVITRLGPDAAHLNEMDISRWYHSGHEDWRRNQLWLEETRSRLDLAIDVITENNGSDVHLANLHVAATQLIQNLIRCGEALLKESPEEYVALVNSISRLGHEALGYQRHREACARAHTELAKLKDPNRKLSEKETLAIVDQLDRILGFK